MPQRSNSPSGEAEVSASEKSGSRQEGRSALFVGVVVTLACVAMNVARNHAGLHARHVELGAEYFRIATALAEGRGFSDPFGAGTGATGWMAPGYAWLLWATNALTGGTGAAYTRFFIPVLVGLKCLSLGLSAGWLWEVLREWAVPAVARRWFFAGWLLVVVWGQWAVVTTSTHDGWWVAFLAVLCLRGVVVLRRGTAPVALLFGLSLAAFSSPVLFTAALLTLAARAIALGRAARRTWWTRGLRPMLPALALGLLCFVGWSVRVRATTGIWAPVKSNGGYELWQASKNAIDGVPTHSTFVLHPNMSPAAKAAYVAEGEKEFVARRGREAWQRIKEAPGGYLSEVGVRALNALVNMQRQRDTLDAGGSMPDALREELTRAGCMIEAPDGRGWRFLFLLESEARRAARVPGLSREAVDVLRAVRERYDEEVGAASWGAGPGFPEIAVSGLPTLGWCLALALAAPRLRRKVALAGMLYLGVLGPYILVSHYYRYQEGLMGLQALAVGLAAGLLAMRLGRGTRGTVA